MWVNRSQNHVITEKTDKSSVLTTDITDRDVVCTNVLQIVDETSLAELHRQDTACSQLPMDTRHLHPKIGVKIIRRKIWDQRTVLYQSCILSPFLDYFNTSYQAFLIHTYIYIRLFFTEISLLATSKAYEYTVLETFDFYIFIQHFQFNPVQYQT